MLVLERAVVLAVLATRAAAGVRAAGGAVTKVYVVMGEVGQYSDWSTWIVRAFASREEADAFAVAARKHLDDLFAAAQQAGLEWWEACDCEAMATFDPQARGHGVELPTYSIVETEVGRWPA